ARRRAELFDDGHQHAGLTAVLQVGEGVDPVVHVHLDIVVVFSGPSRASPLPHLECIPLWERAGSRMAAPRFRAGPTRSQPQQPSPPSTGASARTPTTPAPASPARRSSVDAGSHPGLPRRP